LDKTDVTLLCPTYADIEQAQQRLHGVSYHTPLLRSDSLDLATGAQCWIKPEVLQLTGSFKFRGAYNRLSALDVHQRNRGAVAFSSGNHAQGIAAAAQMLGMSAVIIMPSDAPQLKIERTRAFGAEIILYDRKHNHAKTLPIKLPRNAVRSLCRVLMMGLLLRDKARRD
jgi:threonine dehydratase